MEGRQITEDTTLDADVEYAKGPAFIIAAHGVTLDLNGHRVTGGGSATSPGEGPGIVLQGVSRVTVRNGTVQHFGAGVVIKGGADNVIEQLTISDNLGEVDGDFGDGIVIDGSDHNRVQANTIERNGPYSGIAVIGRSQHNHIVENTVADNNMAHTGKPSDGRQAMGIRIEGPAADHNHVVGNTVSGSGADGIVVLATCESETGPPACAGSPPNQHNEIIGNTSSRNGASGRGDGIRLFAVADPVAAAHTTITGNQADGNATNGIGVDAVGKNNPGPTENVLRDNQGHDNGGFDGFDGNVNPLCGTNIWEGNDFGTVNQPCVSAPGQAPPAG
jgi:hypothetical protein